MSDEKSLTAPVNIQLDALFAYYRDELANTRIHLVSSHTSEETMVELTAGKWTEVLTRFVASIYALLGSGADQKAVEAVTREFYQTVLRPVIREAVGRPILFDLLIGPVIDQIAPQVIVGLATALARVNAPSTPAAPPPGVPILPGGFVPY